MNCKPGDLAIIVKEKTGATYTGDAFICKYPVGAVVKVIEKMTCPVTTLPWTGWLLEKGVPLTIQSAYSTRYVNEAYWCPDEILKPLRGFEDDDSRNFSIDKHQEVTA